MVIRWSFDALSRARARNSGMSPTHDDQPMTRDYNRMTRNTTSLQNKYHLMTRYYDLIALITCEMSSPDWWTSAESGAYLPYREGGHHERIAVAI